MQNFSLACGYHSPLTDAADKQLALSRAKAQALALSSFETEGMKNEKSLTKLLRLLCYTGCRNSDLYASSMH